MYEIRIEKMNMKRLRAIHRSLFNGEKSMSLKKWIRSLKDDPLIEFTGKALRIRSAK